MRRNILVVVMLAMLLPAFGQKLNSRGEKMVSSVYVYQKGDILQATYNFDYNKDGSLYSVTCIQGERKTIIKRNGKGLEQVVWIGNKRDGHRWEYVLNEYGFVSSVKTYSDWVDKSVLDYAYNLRCYEYTYVKELNEYSLSKYSRSQWWAYKNKQPILCDDEYNNEYYEYYNGNPQRFFVVEIEGKERSRRNIPLNYDGNYIDDTNINLCMLNSAFGLINNILAITEWVPFHTNVLPTKENSIVYDYYDGNIVCMKFGGTTLNGTPYVNSIVKINYVED